MTISNAKKIRRGMMSVSKDHERVLHLHLKLTFVYEINFGDLLLVKIFCVFQVETHKSEKNDCAFHF